MATSIEYNGYVITPTPRRRTEPPGWTLEVHLIPVGRKLGLRRCRTSNMYDSQEEAIAGCLELGRRIVDGRARPRPKDSDAAH
ncbi:MAG TPA: hypothetical protein VNL18_14945 [Gemmatimonadales bacterium]|nr:hypothetical protein [Gemmatimonadales bacterium]